MINVILFIAAFLLGSIPFGLLMARAFDVRDLQTRGSGNIGATNVSRVVGFWPAGALTFLLDVVKGAIPVFVLSLPVFQSLWTAWWEGLGRSGVEITDNVIWFTGFCSVFGHCFSPWVRFKGGKGVATGFGVILILTPFAALGGIVAFAFTFLRTKLGSLSSIAGLSIAAIVHLVIRDPGSFKSHIWIGAALLFLILVRHEPNIDSLLEGQERSFK